MTPDETTLHLAAPAELHSGFLRAAYITIDLIQRPLTPTEIVDHALERGLLSDKLSGKTPHQTMKSKLSVHIRRRGGASPFIRTSPGRFYLRRLQPDNVYEAKPVQPPPASERVLVFDLRLLDRLGRFQGIRKQSDRILRELLREGRVRWMDREEAENREDVKQLLSYVLVCKGDAVLAYRRGTYNRVEDFLRGSHCVGFGGHINELDRDLFSWSDFGLQRNVSRELAEELALPPRDRRAMEIANAFRIVGLLNDDSSSNGRRHLAVVWRYEATDDDAWALPLRGEKSITQLRWIRPGVERVNIWQFEYWSQLCLREYFLGPTAPVPTYRMRRRPRLRLPNLCVVGRVGSGKSEAATWIAQRLGYRVVNTGQVLAKLLGVPPVPVTPRQSFQDLAWRFIESPAGPAELAKAIAEEAKLGGGGVVVDGVRQLATLSQLRGLVGAMGVIYVETPPDIAFRFYRLRLGGSPVNIQDFLLLRDAPVERDLGPMIREADAVLYNSFGVPRFREAIRRLLREAGL